jgi:hypothetical protein
MTLRLHLVWKYNQGPIGVYYPLAYADWYVNFYATGGGPLTTINRPHGVTAATSHPTVSNAVPAAMTAPIFNGNNRWYV